MIVDKELLNAVTKASATLLVTAAFVLSMYWSHKEKLASMSDKDDIYKKLLERQTSSLEKIAKIYSGDE